MTTTNFNDRITINYINDVLIISREQGGLRYGVTVDYSDGETGFESVWVEHRGLPYSMVYDPAGFPIQEVEQVTPENILEVAHWTVINLNGWEAITKLALQIHARVAA